MCVCVCVCVSGMEIITRQPPDAGEFVCWRVNWISLPATVAGSFQSDLIQLILMIDILVCMAVCFPCFWLDQSVSWTSEGPEFQHY